MTTKNNKQQGAVSLFVVVFTALLITVVTVSFVRIMIHNQQQATTTDLSQSAYDSAQAGVEDAKRALLRYQSICNTSGNEVACAIAQAQINSSTCNDSVGTLTDVTSSDNEIKIQTGDSNALDQAYTCVKINLNTIDYLGTLSADKSALIPLVGVSAFNTIQIEWFSPDDLSSDANFIVDLQSAASLSWPLLAQNSWKSNRPSIMRTQLMQFSSNGFKLSDFDNTIAGQSDANTLFLYPTGTTGIANATIDTREFINRDIRKTQTGAPLPITCSGNLTTGGYSCTVKLQLPTPIGAGDRTAFLRLSALYNKTNYRVTLLNDAASVEFKAVQPEIDSTGRANDLFRRVQARVELTDANFPYPAAEVDVSGNLCKDFRVTDNIADYLSNCAP